MSKEHLCNRSNFYNAMQIQQRIYEDIQVAYAKAEEIYNRIKEADAWAGANKEVWINNMDMIIKLHNSIPKGADEIFKNMIATMDIMVNENEIISKLGE